MNKQNPVVTYFRESSSLLYSYLISLPLLLLYEVLIFLANPERGQVVRISVDVWIRTLFSYVGSNVMSIILIAAALIGMVILYKERYKLSRLKLNYFLYLMVEATIYAFALALLLSIVVSQILPMFMQAGGLNSLSNLQKIALSLGAGLYEELFFRVVLVSGLLLILKYFISKRWIAKGTAIVLAALIFSLFHYVGALGDAFALGSFLFRFLFGLALNAIYLWRGFGVAAWTHSIYDIMVVVYG